MNALMLLESLCLMFIGDNAEKFVHMRYLSFHSEILAKIKFKSFQNLKKSVKFL